MVTVIATSKEELVTPKHNGATGGDYCDNERAFQFIKDYQEVDFNRSPSCKPLPEDFLDLNHGTILKSSIQGTYFLQVDAIEPFLHNPTNQLLLTLTDGYWTVQALTNHFIPNLNLNTKLGSKLLLTDTIAIENNYLQLTSDNTTFKYGSNTYPRPRSAYRNRGNGSTRPNTEGRRNSSYDNETNFFKRPPPKTTLMDFITTLKISNDAEPEKVKERTENSSKRSSNGSNHNHQQLPVVEQDGFDEQADSEEDPTQANQRERRNPLPPRLQRAQEERTRRNPTRHYDESNPALTSYPQVADPSGYSFANSAPNQLTYYPNPLGYNQQTLLASSYPNEQMNLCCGYAYSTYPSTTSNGERKTNGQSHENGEKGENDSQNPEGKRRNAHQRPRWKINDMCLARWNEDGEFYHATIVDIQPPFCTVLFVDYNTYDQVHFNDLKLVPADQQFYPFIPPTDLNLFVSNGYFPARANYYPPTLDGCLLMPEAPPFPFNSAGTLYMYPADIYSTAMQSNEFFLNSSTSPPSKDSNDTSANDSAEEQQQQQQAQASSSTLVTSDAPKEKEAEAEEEEDQ